MASTKQQPEIRTGFTNISEGKTEINWIHTGMLVIIPALALYGIFTTAFNPATAVFSFIMYLWAGLGITGGKTHFLNRLTLLMPSFLQITSILSRTNRKLFLVYS